MFAHRTCAFALVLALVVPSPAAAAGGDQRAHPEYRERMASVKTVGVVTPEVEAFELTANDARVFRPDWTAQATANVAAGLEEVLRSRGFQVKRLEPASPERKDELEDVSLLYDAVAGAILVATFANDFPLKLERFEYSVGDVQALLAAEGVDALVFTFGIANISSRGRVLMQIAGAAGSGIDYLFVGVVDRSGAVLWFGRESSTATNLLTPGSARAFVEHVTDRLPPVRP